MSTPGRVRVGLIGEIGEEKCKTVDAFGRTIGVIKYRGQLYAIDDECPHRFGPLSLGHIEDGGIVCPLHNWVFELSTGKKRGQPTVTTPIYRVEVEGDEVFVAPWPGA